MTPPQHLTLNLFYGIESSSSVALADWLVAFISNLVALRIDLVAFNNHFDALSHFLELFFENYLVS